MSERVINLSLHNCPQRAHSLNRGINTFKEMTTIHHGQVILKCYESPQEGTTDSTWWQQEMVGGGEG